MGRGRTRSIRFGLALALVAALAAVVAATAAALAFDDATPCPVTIDNGQPLLVCPSATLGGSYSLQLVARGGCEPSFTFAVVNGALPGGLSMSSSALISGTPTQAGTFRFWVRVHDVGPAEGGPEWCTFPRDAEREFKLTIDPRVIVTTPSAPPATIGTLYSLPLVAQMMSGPEQLGPPSSPLTWTIVSGLLPAGLLLDPATGVISGTPTAEGASLFTVRAALADGRSDTKAYEIIARQPLAIQALKPLSAAGTSTLWEVGVPFTGRLAATGGTGTYTWTLLEGALPTGVALAADGSVVGKPNAAGSFRATLRLTDTEGRTADYPAVFNVAARLAVSTLALRTGKVGRLYRAKVVATGGVLPKKWKITKGPLPRGIRFDRTLGLLSGTPTRPGRYRVTFEASDGLKVIAKKTLLIEILA
ncbi:MAG: Ig domain-containing protein [Gaiellaceae bacterium]